MNYLLVRSAIILLILNCVACVSIRDKGTKSGSGPLRDSTSLTYANPVFQPVLADPTIVREGEYFYAYGTEDNWAEEGGYHLVPVIKSCDLVNWSFLSNAFLQKPSWKPKGGIWAPDVTPVDGKFLMYYSFSTWGDENPGIGLAIANKPEGPFADQGKVFDSKEIGVTNSIDPFFIEEKGVKYLFWGSFHGIYAIRLSDDGRRPVGEKVQVAWNHLEGAYIHQRNGYYYLFGSEGSCCEGANSTYRERVGRSVNLLGPYLDKEGNNLASGNYGELILQGNDGPNGFAGPGHNAEIITDDKGNDWLLYHGMLKSKATLGNGTNRRSLMLDKIAWVHDWPQVAGSQPSLGRQPVPTFK